MCELTNGMAGEEHGNGMGKAWARHAMCESAFSVKNLHVCQNRHLEIHFMFLSIHCA
jgi:hypothetical protein